MEDDYYYYSAEQTEDEEEDNYDDEDSNSWSDREPELADGCDALLDLLNPSSSSSKVITRESLLAAQREDMQRVMDLLSVREHSARTLLIHYRWNVDVLVQVYVEKGKSYLFGKAGVTESEFGDLESSSTVMCYICMDDVQGKDATRMDCGHCFCNECWTEHFIVKIKDGQSKQIRCMAHKCNAICDETVIRKLVNLRQPDLAERFERFLLESYIEDNKMVKWCPSIPHCGNAIRIEKDQILEVECSCGWQFCFGCTTKAHSPCSCLMWQMWTKKCQDESETVNWITSNTKPCPKCSKAVEKNGGCNLVTCTCGQHFCWLCGGATGSSHTYQSIAGHTCGSYKEASEKKAKQAKHYLDRYIHYHDRYQGHTESLKKESELSKTLNEKVVVLEAAGEKDGSKLIDFSWVTNGLDMLSRSRKALSYSYPFAFYMFGDELFDNEMTEEERQMKKNLFEDQQQQLESNVERLSKVLEEPFDEFSQEKISEVRMQVINFSTTTNTLCKKMYECIENDLLAPLMYSAHEIAPYQLNGAEKAVKLCSLD